MRSHEGAQAIFLELSVITSVYKLFIHGMSWEREAESKSRNLPL